MHTISYMVLAIAPEEKVLTSKTLHMCVPVPNYVGEVSYIVLFSLPSLPWEKSYKRGAEHIGIPMKMEFHEMGLQGAVNHCK